MDNIVKMLRLREYRKEKNVRLDYKVVRKLVCQKDVTFTKVWENHTTQPVAYECGKLYFENYRKCMTLYGPCGYPHLLYRLPPCSTHQKIEDCLLAQMPTERLLAGTKGNRSAMLALTADNHLLRYDLSTGQVLQDIYLSPTLKFKHISWDTVGYTFTVRSTHKPYARGSTASSVLMVLMLFTVFPLECTAVMEVTKTVFGRDVVDAMISQGVLIVMHQGGLLKFYSTEHILQKGKLFDLTLGLPSPVESQDQAIIGLPPLGLPINVKLSECPEVVFEVKCSEHKLCIGGAPWHYIITPVGYHGVFSVYTLASKALVENGTLDMGTLPVEPDKCFFHADDSGRILHIGTTEVRILKLKEKETNKTKETVFKLVEDYIIRPFQETQENPKVDPTMYTSSGRAVKKKYYQESIDVLSETAKLVQTVDYEEDLELLILTSVHQVGDSYEGKIHLYDNLTGDMVQEVVLKEPWKEFCDHVVLVDLDTIIHLVKGPMRKFDVYIYRLDRTDGMEDNPKQRPQRKHRDLSREAPSTSSNLVEQYTSARTQRRTTRSNSSIR